MAALGRRRRSAYAIWWRTLPRGRSSIGRRPAQQVRTRAATAAGGDTRAVIAITRSKYGLPISDIFFAESVHERLPRTPLCVFQQTAHQDRRLTACADIGDRPHRPDRGHLRTDLEEHALQDQARRARGARSATRDGPDRRGRAAVRRLLRHLCSTQRVAAVQPDEAPSAWWVLGPAAVLGHRCRRQCLGSPCVRQGLLVGPGATPLLRVALPCQQRQWRAQHDRSSQPPPPLARDRHAQAISGSSSTTSGEFLWTQPIRRRTTSPASSSSSAGSCWSSTTGSCPRTWWGECSYRSHGDGWDEGSMTSSSSERSGRLALLTSQMEDGGAQRAMLKLAGGLAERGYPVDLVLAQARGRVPRGGLAGGPGRRPRCSARCGQRSGTRALPAP